MKFTLSWLKRHLDTGASLDEICEKLTMIGLELESLDNPAERFAPFKVALIEKAEQHPDADRLKVCTVKTDDGTFNVVCGAPNAKTGLKGIFAPEGSYIPGTDMTLKKGVIRGVESCGMMVSESEMGLSDEHDGIIELDGDYEIGTPMAEIFGLNDPVIEINLTPNRPDCSGVRGIARDLAAAGLGTLKDQDESAVKGGFKSSVDVSLKDDQGCPLFLGREIKGVKNGASPEWMQALLKAVGLRPISALVDITNFMTMDQCRPLHVYDVAKLQGDIYADAANGGEELDALNDKSYALVQNAVTINDDRGVIGLGGIVGGTSTGCEDDVSDVFLESAYFDPMRIARTGRDLSIDSDARYRFERGIDPEFTFAGIEMATRLIIEICGGEASEIVQAGDVPDWKREISYEPSYTEKLMGYDVAVDAQESILKDLGFDVKKSSECWSVSPPSWRGDIVGKPDLVEEVTRIDGFEKIPAVSVNADHVSIQGAETLTGSRIRKSRTVLAARGLYECVTWSFLSKDLASFFAHDDAVNDNADLRLSNPISSELDQMRPSILPNLLMAAGRNADKGLGSSALCEVGPVFNSSKVDGQDMVATGLRAGVLAGKHWSDKNADRSADLYDAKADALAVLESCGVASNGVQISRDAPGYYHPGRSGALRQGKTVLAYFGELHPGVLEEMDVKFAASGFEVFIERIPAARSKGTAKKMLKLDVLQPVNRDFAFVVSDDVSANDLLGAVKAADKKLISGVQVFDIYAGKGIDEGCKSIAISVTLQPKDQTLTEADLENVSNAIVEKVSAKTGGVLRG